MQLITVEELVNGREIDYPRTSGVNQSYKQAPRAVAAEREEHGDLFGA
jgi:hypothetical protein